jgi:hypothetical protein
MIFVAFILRDLPELLPNSFKVFHDFLGDDIGTGEVVGDLKGFVLP